MPETGKDFVLDLPPRWKHDCLKCQYLGQLADYDLYYCPGPITHTVIARYSDEGSEYLSGWGSRLAPLLVAEALAHRKGIVTDRVG